MIASRFTIESQDGIVHLQFSGQPTLQEIMAAFQDLNALADSQLRLWNFPDGLNLTAEELQDIADFTARQTPQPQRVAIVTAQDLAYGLMRMFQAYRQEGGHSSIRVYRNLDDARRFLLTGD